MVFNPHFCRDDLEIDENNALVLTAYLFIAPHLNPTIVQQHRNERTVSHELQTRRIRVEGFTPQMTWGLNSTVTLLLL